jgi:hypothetical protein
MSDDSDGTRGKRPPAPSVTERSAGPDLKAEIADEIYAALHRLDADEELLAIVGSWRDTLDDAEVLALLREWNEGGPMLHRGQ